MQCQQRQLYVRNKLTNTESIGFGVALFEGIVSPFALKMAQP